MSKIVLEVDTKNKDTVLMILNNLKQGLIKNISIDNKTINNNLEAKKTVKRSQVEDDFFEIQPTGGKYLSKSAYKAKISKFKE